MYLVLTCAAHLQIIGNLGASEIDADLETRLVDGILYAFQEQVGLKQLCHLVAFHVCVWLIYWMGVLDYGRLCDAERVRCYRQLHGSSRQNLPATGV